MQGPDRGGGLPLSPHLQPLPQKYQADHQRRALKVQMHHRARRRAQPQPNRQCPTRRGAQGHQQVHVAAATFEGVPPGPIKAGTQHKLHRGSQRKLPQRREHPVLPDPLAQHGHHQRQRQHQAPGHRRKVGPGPSLGCVNGGIRRLGLIARVPHGPAQQGLHGRALWPLYRKRNTRGLGGQINRRVVHARHPL